MSGRKKRGVLVLLLTAVIALLLSAAFAGRKALGSWRGVRTQLDAIEENTLVSRRLLNSFSFPSGTSPDSVVFDYDWLDGQFLIAHALGDTDGHTYTNSREALEQAYRDGIRLFEADFQILDGHVVLMHDARQFCESAGLDPTALDYDSFRSAKIFGTFSPLVLEDLLMFMSEHPDMILITDSKYSGGAESAFVLSSLVLEAEKLDPSVLDRVVVQIYNQNMLRQVMGIFPFRSVIYTLYISPDSDEQAIRFCLESGVGAVTAHVDRMSPELLDRLHAAGLYALVHPVSSAKDANDWMQRGADAVYSEFVTPDQLKAPG